jgi:hypothetical protein
MRHVPQYNAMATYGYEIAFDGTMGRRDDGVMSGPVNWLACIISGHGDGSKYSFYVDARPAPPGPALPRLIFGLMFWTEFSCFLEKMGKKVLSWPGVGAASGVLGHSFIFPTF